MSSPIILAVDQATHTGFCLMQYGKILACGNKDFSKTKGFIKRISEIKYFVKDMVEKNNVVIVTLEDTQLQANTETFKKLTKLLGNLEVMLYEKNIEFHIVSASEWKGTCKIKGRDRETQKANAIKFIKEKFDLDVDSDTADSICLAWHTYKKICSEL